MKIKDLPIGMIIWYINNDGDNDILGITGMTLDDKYLDYECIKLEGNRFDYMIKGDIIC